MSHCFFKKLVDSTNSQRLVSIHENKRMPAVNYCTLKYNFVQTELSYTDTIISKSY